MIFQGIKFEPNSFKLTHEMITLMGGKTSQGYRQFCELTVKAFLSCRAYVEDVVSTCQLMMPTDLPSFKGEGTMIRLRDRFKPDLTEREAAKYMQGVIDNACENSMSIVYDQFQVSLLELCILHSARIDALRDACSTSKTRSHMHRRI
jgi:phosphatidylinositol 4-kinase